MEGKRANKQDVLIFASDQRSRRKKKKKKKGRKRELLAHARDGGGVAL